MAARPWVTPEEVKEYTDKERVKARADSKVKADITRAEQYVIRYTNNSFADYSEIPETVKLAVILIAEVYGNSAADVKGEYKSETFDDYSYTRADTATTLENLDLGSLLDEFVLVAPRNAVTMRMRKL